MTDTDVVFKNGNVALGTTYGEASDLFSVSDKWAKALFDNLKVVPVSN